MSGRIASYSLYVTLLPFVVLAQEPAPPEVDQALRARVSEFLQYHVDGNFRKAYDMVAEETRDYYFNMGKSPIKAFTIEGVKYSDNFTKAAVATTMSKTVNVAGTDIPVTLPSTITWKVENGKWVWYQDVKPGTDMPFGPSSPALPAAVAPNRNDSAATGLPKDFSDQTIAAAARAILQQVGVDKKEVTLAANKASEERVVFHNGMPGSVQLELSAPDIPGFTAEIGQSLVRAGSDVALRLRYEPRDTAERRDPANVELTVQPLNQTFVIRVNFAAPDPAAPK